MKKQLVSIFLAAVLLLCLIPMGTVTASADSAFEVSQECVELIKQFEGFRQTPYWDYSQYTVGYGTRPLNDKDLARYRAEGISKEEAHDLLMVYLNNAGKSLNSFIDKYDLKLTQGQFDALLSLTFNCGSAWLYQESNFRSAVIEGRIGNDFLFAIGQWCTAGGEVHKGLIRRRLIEANLYLNGICENVVPDNYCYVLFDANGGTSDVRVQAYDSKITASIIAVPTYEGYLFDGWYTEPNGGSRVNLLTDAVRNDTLYAHWNADPDYVPGEPTEPTEPATEPTVPTVPEGDSEQLSVKVTVNANKVNVRQGPGTGYTVVTRVNSGDELVITEISEDDDYVWGKCEHGWIALKYTDYSGADEDEKPAEPETRMGTVTGDALRIRTGPSTGYGIVGHLYIGNRVEIMEIKTVGSSQWGKISNGWISMDYVKLDTAEEPDPTEPTEPPTEPTEPPTEPTEPPTEPTEPPTEPTEPPTEPTEPETEDDGTGMGTVTGDALRIRAGAGTTYKVVGHLYIGDRVEILEQKTVAGMVWGRTEKGWICMDYVEMDTPEEEKLTGTIVVDGLLRIRSGAGLNCTIVGYLENGNKIEILEQKTVSGTVWGRMEKGWISMDYVKLDGAEEDQPQTLTVTVTASCLRIRSGAGVTNSIVGYLYSGAEVEILETTSVTGTVWGRTADGWISMIYVE